MKFNERIEEILNESSQPLSLRKFVNQYKKLDKKAKEVKPIGKRPGFKYTEIKTSATKINNIIKNLKSLKLVDKTKENAHKFIDEITVFETSDGNLMIKIMDHENSLWLEIYEKDTKRPSNIAYYD
jgi:cell fate (sporulation/competence/biofilm development) regulator YmcA (YheA/YmcA/DUF963 family)